MGSTWSELGARLSTGTKLGMRPTMMEEKTSVKIAPVGGHVARLASTNAAGGKRIRTFAISARVAVRAVEHLHCFQRVLFRIHRALARQGGEG